MINVNDFLSMQIHGGSDSDGIAARVEGLLTFIEDLIAKDSGEITFTLMPGLAEMPNIHPLLVHFPIAFLTAFLALDFFGSLFKQIPWRNVAGWLLYLGTVSALLTVAAGFQAAATVPHGDAVHVIMEQHKNHGLFVLGIAVFLSLWRIAAGGVVKSLANGFYLLLSAVMVIIMVLGADLGGLMVYQHGIGVTTVAKPAAETTQDHHHDHNHSH